MTKKTYPKVQTRFVDLLTFSTISPGDRVALTTETGVVTDFNVSAVGQDDSIILQQKQTKPLSSIFEKNSIILSSYLRTREGNLKLQPGQAVEVLKGAKKIRMEVHLVADDSFVILRVPGKKKMNFLSRLKVALK